MFNVFVNGNVTNGSETGTSFYENCELNLKQDEQVNRGEDIILVHGYRQMSFVK